MMVGIFLYCELAIYNTLLTALGDVESEQYTATKNKDAKVV